MNKFKFLILLCVLLVACKNEAKNTDQTNDTNLSPKEEVTVKEEARAIVEKPETVIENKDTKIDTVTVSNLVDFVENAKSNTVLILEKGTYNLDKDLVYSMTKEGRKIIDKKVVETRSIGGQLHFSGLNNIQIIGKKGAVIVSKNPKAVALFLFRCNNVKVSNLTIKKNIVGLVDLCYLSYCNNVEIDKCKFDGGGTYGIYTNNVNNVTVSNSLITKCTSGAIKINQSVDLKYVNTTITNNITTVSLVNFYGTGSTVTFHGVNIIDNKRNEKSTFQGSEKIIALGVNSFKLNNCVIRDNKGFTHLGAGQYILNRSEVDGVLMQ